jgi:hypothetical protein
VQRNVKPSAIDAVKVLACVGSRPAELESGVQVYRDELGIHFTIIGAKVSDKKGQLWREITLQHFAMVLNLHRHASNEQSQPLVTDHRYREPSTVQIAYLWGSYVCRLEPSSDLVDLHYTPLQSALTFVSKWLLDLGSNQGHTD